MAIIHAFISRNNEIILVEFTEHQGNFQQISRILLRKLKNEKKLTIDYNNFQFHYLNDDETNISFMCMTDNTPFEIAFGFMSDCKRLLFERYKYDEIKTAYSYQLQDFEEIIKELIIYYSGKPSLTKYGTELSSLGSTRNVEIKKVESILKNDEKIDIFAVQTNVIKKNYQSLNSIERKIKYQENYKKIKFGLLVSLGCIIIIIIIKYLFS